MTLKFAEVFRHRTIRFFSDKAELPADTMKRPEVTQHSEITIWLLQREDTPFLCLSFFASVLLHGLLFVILAATRIFQPFAGVSGEFELVWFSPSPMESERMAREKKPGSPAQYAARKGVKRAYGTRAQKHRTARQRKALPPTERTSLAVSSPSSRVLVAPEKPDTKPLSAEADAEMIVSRFGGKVVDIVGKDIEIPVYEVFSAAQKSPDQRAMVQYFPDADNYVDDTPLTMTMQEEAVPLSARNPAGTGAVKRVEQPVAKAEPVVASVAKKEAVPTEPLHGKPVDDALTRKEKSVPPSVAKRGTMQEKTMAVRERPVQHRQSSSVVRTVPEARSPVRGTVAIPREQPRVAAVPVPAPGKPVVTGRSVSHSAARETVRPRSPEVVPPGIFREKQVSDKVKEEAKAEAKVEARTEATPVPATPVTKVELKAEPKAESKAQPLLGKPSPVVPEKPRAIFVPPLSGDLKIVITGGEDVKVEAVFREFRKARRGRPLTRGEARNTRSVTLKRARTTLNVHETVIEIAEEGVYDLRVRSADGKPVTAAFVLKICESGHGAVTKKLGRRTLPDGALLARILMPEGILWDDEAYFSGSMEDSDSVTRFHTDTGLVWREFR
jgi:hypothetical protein